MNKKCSGCGKLFQTIDPLNEGFIPENKYNDSMYCQRCFKLMHYNKLSNIDKKVNIDELTKRINKEMASVVYVIDILTISKTTLSLINKIKTNLYVVLTKKDLLPKSVKDSKLINYIKENTNAKNVFVVSNTNKHNIDLLYNALNKDKFSKIYVCGFSNAGKSALINSLFKSVGKDSLITVSSSLNTTLEEITLPLNEFITLIDTPGFHNDNSISNNIDIKDYVNLLPKKEIKPRIHLLKPGFMIILPFIRIENNTNDFVRLSFYINNSIKLEKIKSIRNDKYKDLENIKMEVDENEDLVIEGVGFVKVIDKCKIDIYTVNKRIISKRRKLV